MNGNNVRLFRARTDDVERQLHQLGVHDEEGLVLLVEFCVLFLERSSKAMKCSLENEPPLPTVSSLPVWEMQTEKVSSFLYKLLAAVHAYTSQGSLGGVSLQVCDLLQPLLVRLMKVLLSGAEVQPQLAMKGSESTSRVSGGEAVLVALNSSFPEIHTCERASNAVPLSYSREPLPKPANDPPQKEEDGGVDVSELLDSLSLAMTSCTGGAARREADAVLEMNITSLLSPFSGEAIDEDKILSVTFGFADYADCETAADLWGGSMSLSLFLMEQWKTHVVDFHKRIHEQKKSALKGQPVASSSYRVFRVLELGCGTGLVSLVFVKRLVQHIQQHSNYKGDDYKMEGVIEVHVTDLCSAAVEQVYRSFVEKNSHDYDSVIFKRYTAEQVCDGEVMMESDDATSSRKSRSLSESGAVVEVHLYPLDMCNVPCALYQQFDLVLAGDIIYDYQTVPKVYPSLTCLLADHSDAVRESDQNDSTRLFSGGMAILCCESHRDGMNDFIAARNNQERLETISYIQDVRVALNHFSLLEELCSTMCSVLTLQSRKPRYT